jgi:hypothetical protein
MLTCRLFLRRLIGARVAVTEYDRRNRDRKKGVGKR